MLNSIQKTASFVKTRLKAQLGDKNLTKATKIIIVKISNSLIAKLSLQEALLTVAPNPGDAAVEAIVRERGRI